ncbi:glycosyltransferase family 2 protein [Dictyobacter aurantiacus]|uniref:Glycosyl transferase n=1 Tax=Dictyobacter aurantiacus TaxID=1936993 RepID=A0A401ZR84_9CHLR|nr:glycosyltransferase [Dictyobacter aurantiacus]GCE09418.1 glycosyl transferase [Dictyobacter aurantiacus]
MQFDNTLADEISIVIISRNRAHSLDATLQKLLSLHEPVPIIVVDNHSEDETIQLVSSRYPDVTLIQRAENDGSSARNIGAKHARTPYIAFADDDSWWEDGALRAAVTYFEHYPTLGLIQGKILLREGQIEPACQLMDKSPIATPDDFPGKYILGFIACGAVIRKDVFLDVGGFHRNIGVGGEEELIALDMAERGWTLAYVPDILAHHAPAPQRNKAIRKQLVVRNHLWSVWLRRSLSGVLAETSPLLRQAVANRDVRKGVMEACTGLPWILKERKPLNATLEQEVVKLSRFHP